ncbi:hypothetical protein B9057_01615 [Aestuarium zhoushanense]|nr:hypothetical protein B9057_01615 [Aestuarium zhoushanense]
MKYSYRTRSTDCPYELAMGLVSKRWKARVLDVLSRGTLRYGDLKDALAGVSDKVLSSALDELTRDGLISRTAFAEIPPRVEYALTPQGEGLLAAMEPLRQWAERENGR